MMEMENHSVVVAADLKPRFAGVSVEGAIERDLSLSRENLVEMRRTALVIAQKSPVAVVKMTL